MRRAPIPRSIVAAAVAAALLLAACGGDDDGDASGTATDATSDAPAADTGAPPAATDATDATDATGSTAPPASPPGGEASAAAGAVQGLPTSIEPGDREVDQNGTFRYAYEESFSILDPHKSPTTGANVYLFAAYDRLIDTDASMQFVPGLAESWEFNGDATALTLHLRDGVLFHDGTTMDANAVKLSLERAMTLPDSAVKTNLAPITAIEAVDPLTVELSFNAPSVQILGALAERSGVVISAKALADGVNLETAMVGAGPFRLVEAQPGARAVYERFEEYWNRDQVQLQRVEITPTIDPMTRLNALQSGQVDAANLPPTQFDSIKGNSSFQTVALSTIQYYNMYQNRARSEFGDERVRQAMMHAIDREAICASIVMGYCELGLQTLPAGFPENNPEVTPHHYPYDPDKARQLLAEAGLPDGFSFELWYPSGSSPIVEISQAVAAQLGEVGIQVELVAGEGLQLATQAYDDEIIDVLQSFAVNQTDPQFQLAYRFLPEARVNPGGHSTPEFVALYEQLASTVDPDERIELFHQIQQEIVDSVLEINLFFRVNTYALSSGVAEFTPSRRGPYPDFRTIAMGS